MVFKFYLMLLLLFAAVSGESNVQRYEAIDPSTFQIFESLWSSTHESWLRNDHNQEGCFNSTSIIFPVCHNGVVIEGDYSNQESDMTCAQYFCTNPPKGSCTYTPSDTIDYLPSFESKVETSTICEPPADAELFYPKYGLDEGLPPLFTPVSPYRLDIFGQVTSNFGDECRPIVGATVDAWHIDPTSLKKYSASSEYQDLFDSTTATDIPDQFATNVKYTRKSPTSPRPPSLRDISCSGRQRTIEEGKFEFATSMPPSYGPPRHVVFRVTAPGYHTLYTRVYFDRDGRLKQLTGSIDDVPMQIFGQSITSLSGSHVQMSPDDPSTPLNWRVNKYLTKDPRVARLYIQSILLSSTVDVVFGRFRIDVKFVLTPMAETVSKDSKTPMDIRGLWADQNGELVNIDVLGTQFVATEYPHARTWASVTGVIQADAIRGVNFFNPKAAASWMIENAEGIKSVTTNPDLSRLVEIKPVLVDGAEVWPTRTSQLPSSLRTVGLTTGVILPTDNFASTANEMSITWSGGGYSSLWSKVLSPEQHGYRFFKLVILRDTGGFPGGKLVINEVELYSGILAEKSYPFPKLKTPRTPAPMLVYCSSYTSTDTHCFKALDGDRSSNSYWMTDAVGDRRTSLTEPQWLMLDLGPGHYMMPTAIRIVCDAGKRVPFGCPRTFTLIGSRDNQQFDVIYSTDMYDYNNSYAAPNGQLFTFFWEHAEGRSNGHICGSCDLGPNFRCALDAYDATCVSTYCNSNGVCDDTPNCKLGEYYDVNFVADGLKADRCLPCPAGRFGNSTILRSSACSGRCSPGYFCPTGSSSSMQVECGGTNVICPEGSEAPSEVSMGKYSIVSANSTEDLWSVELPTTRYLEAFCPPGYYCVNGSVYECPVGTFGNGLGLASPSCTDACRPGQYCDSGSVVPTICEEGYYCPDGRIRIPCPAGTFGGATGLRDATCSGLCSAGYYCPLGSVSPNQVICPAGTFGSTAGLGDAHCSGSCAAGYFCPAGSTTSMAYPCTSPSLFCPLGSGIPQVVGFGNYSIIGNETNRQDQSICSVGYYCQYGLQIPCPSGSFGNVLGLNYGSTRYIGGQDAIDAHYVSAQAWITKLLNVVNGLISVDLLSLWSNKDINPDGFYCSGFCLPGYYCTPGSISSTQAPCPAGRYGLTSGLKDASCTAICPVGHYCPSASPAPIKCRAGIFGNLTGLTSKECSIDCASEGCPVAYCKEGYYCPEGSTVADQRECGGNGFYCPLGSAVPTPVGDGYYTVGLTATTRSAQHICEPGYFCVGGVKSPCFPGYYGDREGLDSSQCSGICPLGYYCPAGTANATKNRCPAGRYGGSLGLSTSSCSGLCTPGYYCPEGSISATQYLCATADESILGHIINVYNTSGILTGYLEKFPYTIQTFPYHDIYGNLRQGRIAVAANPNMVYCLSGSSLPLLVDAGYYSVGNNMTTRSNELVCDPGSYCVNGMMYDCPAGRYGINSGLSSPQCSGPCTAGYYCPRGSTSRTMFPCPRGRYGSEEGLGDAACSGACGHVLDCPPGSVQRAPLTTSHGSSVW